MLGGGGTTQIDVQFGNSGALSLQTGTLKFTQTVFQNGANATTVLQGGSLTVTGGQANPFRLDGGTFSGFGMVTGDIKQTGGILTPGSSAQGGSPGVLTILGNYTQANADAALQIIANNNGVSVLNVQRSQGAGGQVRLQGKLVVKRDDAYKPTFTTDIAFLTFNSIDPMNQNFTAKDFGSNNLWNAGGDNNLYFGVVPQANSFDLFVFKQQ